MVLIGPGIVGLMFILMIISNRIPKIPLGLEPFIWIAGLGLLTFMCMMLMMNVFGMERNGFRCYVLMPVQRAEILFGKNIALLPGIAAIALFGAIGLYYVAPVGPLNLLGSICQFGITFVLASLAGNWVSIYFPIAMRPGVGKPVQVNLLTMLVQIVVILGCPLFLVPGLVFYAIEWAIRQYFEIRFLPLYATLSAIELWLALKTYRYALERQGSMLQKRETKILEVLTGNVE